MSRNSDRSCSARREEVFWRERLRLASPASLSPLPHTVNTPITMVALTLQTCKLALPARKAAARNTRARTAVVAKAPAPVSAVRVQQKVRYKEKKVMR